jgi:hypothetical protein
MGWVPADTVGTYPSWSWAGGHILVGRVAPVPAPRRAGCARPTLLCGELLVGIFSGSLARNRAARHSSSRLDSRDGRLRERKVGSSAIGAKDKRQRATEGYVAAWGQAAKGRRADERIDS